MPRETPDERLGTIVDFVEVADHQHQMISSGDPLFKLYRATGEPRYLELARFFLDQRGHRPSVFLEEMERLDPEDTRLNRHFFGGKIERQTVKGWGYSYHILPKLGPMAGTRMAARPGAPKVKTFVKIGGEPYWVRYNSKLPVVVYAPEGVEVRYRLWSSEGTGEPVPKG